MSLGSKIKALRKMHGITQSALAEGIVTHGMLSRIEHEDAVPSLGTLCALADRLSVSPGYLLDPSDDLFPALRTHTEKQIADAFDVGAYAKCLALFENSGLPVDKGNAALYVHSAWQVGLQTFFKGDLPTAQKWLIAAKEHLAQTVVPLAEVRIERIAFVLLLISRIDTLPSVIPEAPDKPDFGFQPSLFFYCLRKLEDGQPDAVRPLLALGVLDAPYAAYVDAKLKLADYKFIDAILALRPIAASGEVPCFLALLAAAALEDCCKTCEDYKGAYESRERREAILAGIVR